MRNEGWWLWYEEEALLQWIKIAFVRLHRRFDSKRSVVATNGVTREALLRMWATLSESYLLKLDGTVTLRPVKALNTVLTISYVGAS